MRDRALQERSFRVAIVASVVDGRDGRIGVGSSEGRGTTSRVEIPLHDELQDVAPTEAAA